MLAKFKSVYGETDDILLRYEEYDSFKREKDQSVKEYVHIFEQKIAELKSFQFEIPELMQSHKLFKCAGLRSSDLKLAFQTCPNIKEFKHAKETLLKLSDHIPSFKGRNIDKDEGLVKVKEEKTDDEGITFFTDKVETQQCDTCHETFYNNSKRKIQSNQNWKTENRLCYGCGAPNHWIRDCPHIQFTLRNENNQ